MTGNQTIDAITAILGAIYAVATAIALLSPKGSKIGIIAGKIGADLKAMSDLKQPEATGDVLDIGSAPNGECEVILRCSKEQARRWEKLLYQTVTVVSAPPIGQSK